MIYALVCRCANSEPRTRTFLRENGYSKWQSIPVAKGKEACLNLLNTFPPENKEMDKLKMYIKRVSSWAVLVGTDGSIYQWADLGNSTIKEKLDAQIIIRDFGNE